VTSSVAAARINCSVHDKIRKPEKIWKSKHWLHKSPSKRWFGRNAWGSLATFTLYDAYCYFPDQT